MSPSGFGPSPGLRADSWGRVRRQHGMSSAPERYRCCAPAGPKLRAVAYSLQEVPRWERPACAQGLAPHRGNLLPNEPRQVCRTIYRKWFLISDTLLRRPWPLWLLARDPCRRSEEFRDRAGTHGRAHRMYWAAVTEAAVVAPLP